MSANDFDDVGQLQAKVAMLTAALRKMDADCAHKVNASAMLGIDCTNAFTEFAEWAQALLLAIDKFSQEESPNTTVINSLAGISRLIAEQAIEQAESFGSDAEKLLDSCRRVTA